MPSLRAWIEKNLRVSVHVARGNHPRHARAPRGINAVFVAVLGMDGFASTKFDGLAGDPDFLSLQAGEMHFDTMSFAIVERVMFESRELKRAAEFAVDPRQKVEIELRGDALRRRCRQR